MNKWSEILLGLIFIIVPVALSLSTWGTGTWDFGMAAWEFFKGGLMWFLVLVGLLFLMLGISDLKEPASAAMPAPADAKAKAARKR